MTQKDKELLLKDLCARLPYGVILNGKKNGRLVSIEFQSLGEIRIRVIIVNFISSKMMFFNANHLEEHLPYLRPLSSMTKKEKEEMDNFPIYHSDFLKVDFYNKHHIDYRGLIPMGLALEAPEGMYETG